MTSIIVNASTGTYRVPGVVETLETARCFETVPPSTVAGFLESLCGREFGDFARSGSRVAYGETRKPAGSGKILRKDAVVTNPQGGFDEAIGNKNSQRPIFHETLYDLEYRMDIEGPYADLVTKAVKGEIPRKGVLCLGESDDLVDSVRVVEEPIETNWVVSVTRGEGQVWLPVRVWRFRDKVRPNYGTFKRVKSLTPPETAWLTPGGLAK